MSLYHYTNYDSYWKIKNTKCLNATKTINGWGVFFTTLNPRQYSKDDIAETCWEGGASRKLQEKRVDYYIELAHVDLNQFSHVRDDAIYKSEKPINLDEFHWTSGKNSSWSSPLVVAGISTAAVVAVPLILSGIETGLQLYKSYNDSEKEKKDRSEKMETRLRSIVTSYKGNKDCKIFKMEKKVDESKGYSFLFSPKGHILRIECVFCQHCCIAIPSQEASLEKINENKIRSVLKNHRDKCIAARIKVFFIMQQDFTTTMLSMFLLQLSFLFSVLLSSAQIYLEVSCRALEDLLRYCYS